MPKRESSRCVKRSVPLFPGTLWMAPSVRDGFAWIEKQGGEAVHYDGSVGGHETISVRSDGISSFCQGNHLIAIDPDGGPGVIAHEAVHVTWAILDDAGIQITPDNHEVQAYLVTWICDEYQKFRESLEQKKPIARRRVPK